MLKEINAMMSLENMALTRKELNCLGNCLAQPAIIPCVRRDIIQNYQKPVILQSQTKDDCYPDTSILINLLNLQNEDELFDAERQLVSLRLLEFYLDPIEGTFDLTYLKTLHHFLFQDLYSWAGEIRTCNIAKGSLFCLAPYIESYAQEIFRSLKQNHYYFQLPDDKKILVPLGTGICFCLPAPDLRPRPPAGPVPINCSLCLRAAWCLKASARPLRPSPPEKGSSLRPG